MKHLLTDEITELAGFRPTDNTLKHLQEAYEEAIQVLSKILIPDPTKVTILYGAGITKVINNYGNIAGAAYYNGEIYLIDAGQVLVGLGQIAVWQIVETFRTSDPVIFTDNSEQYVHQIKKLKLVAGESGSGLADWDKTMSFNSIVDVPDALVSVNFLENAIGRMKVKKVGIQVTCEFYVHGTTTSDGGFTWVIAFPDGYKCRDIVGLAVKTSAGDTIGFISRSNGPYSLQINDNGNLSISVESDGGGASGIFVSISGIITGTIY